MGTRGEEDKTTASGVQAKEWRGASSSEESRQYTTVAPSHWYRAGVINTRRVKTAADGSRSEQDAGDGEAIMRPVDGCCAARH